MGRVIIYAPYIDIERKKWSQFILGPFITIRFCRKTIWGIRNKQASMKRTIRFSYSLMKKSKVGFRINPSVGNIE